MGVGGVNGERDRSTRFRVSKNRDSCEEILGKDKGEIEILCPQERFARTFQGIGERSKDLRGVSEKSPVEINHTEKTLQSRFIRGRRKIGDGGGVLGEGAETGAGEMVSQEFSLRHTNSHLPRPIVRP